MDLSFFLVVILTLHMHGAICLSDQRIQRAVNSRLNFFDIDLLRYAAEDKTGNVMISPASIKSLLAMLLEGAEASTADELRRALRLSPSKEDYREEMNTFIGALKTNNSGAIIENANGVFVSDKLKVKKTYQEMLRSVYLSEIKFLDFRNPILSASTINDWVNTKTRGLIPMVVEPPSIGPSTSVLLLNALYFKSNWLKSFDSKQTKPGCFYSGGKCREVMTMLLHSELQYAYVESLRSHVVELPYEGGRYSMFIMLPEDRDGCVSVIRDLPYTSLAQVLLLMDSTEVYLTLPKFTIDYSVDLVEILKNVRINSLFSTNANLSGIFEDNQPLQVNNIFHKTHLEVNEVGTIAAAATGAMVVPLIGYSNVQLKVDHPFLFFIRDNVTGAVLFEGKIDEPDLAVGSLPIPVVVNDNGGDGTKQKGEDITQGTANRFLDETRILKNNAQGFIRTPYLYPREYQSSQRKINTGTIRFHSV